MGLGLIGGIIRGAEDQKSTSESRLEVSDPGAFEASLRQQQQSQFDDLSRLTQASGLGAGDVQAAVGAQRGIADLLKQMQDSSGLPNQQDILRSQELTKSLFAPQQEALKQGFEQQRIGASRQAAFLGREANDPILAARLAQDQTRQQSMLAAEQGAAAQNLAFQLPGQRLGFASQRADVLGGLANQAFSNRQSLLSLGNQLSQQERQFRLQTGTQRGTNIQEGSLGQALLGGAAGLGQDLQNVKSIMGLAGGPAGMAAGAAGGAAGGGAVAGMAGRAAPVVGGGGQIFPGQQGGIMSFLQPQTFGGGPIQSLFSQMPPQTFSPQGASPFLPGITSRTTSNAFGAPMGLGGGLPAGTVRSLGVR